MDSEEIRESILDAAEKGHADKLARLITSHLSPLTDRSDFVRVFLNERQHLPRESRRRIGKWSRGLERVFEDVLKRRIRPPARRGRDETAEAARPRPCGASLRSLTPADTAKF